LLAAALLALGMLAAGSVLASEVPGIAAWPLAFAAVGYGQWLGRCEVRRHALPLLIPCGDGEALLGGVAMAGLEVQWRGPLAFLQWRDPRGLRRRLQFWPDTLPARARRELRLAMVNHLPARAAGSMAP
jgi:toxin CptA